MIIESTAENNKSIVVRRGDWTNFEVRSNGTVYARNVWVKLGGFPDFVFSKDYPLPTIDEIKDHIREHGKLSELPSAAQVEIEGIDLGEMNKLLVKKVEELTLYVIQLHDAIELMKADRK